jgi:predicted AAA+ superfamily ATPase
MIERLRLLNRLQASLKRSQVTSLLGPRQCGKTTLARMLASRQKSFYFDLENSRDIARMENPMRSLEDLRGTIIIDEIQRHPDLLKTLRVFADRRPQPARFLILGSASFDLIRKASESLAGRVEFVDMSGFSLEEVGPENVNRLWYRGGYPRAFIARSNGDCEIWRESFIRTFLERDIPQLGIRVPALTLRRFWTMVAHYHAQIWNGSEIGASLGVSHVTARQYLDILTGTFVLRQLLPWFENLGKRMVRSPKVFVRDSGLFHSLLRIPDLKALESHPKLGASWEGFAMEQVLGFTGERDAYFWATHSGAELDLLLFRRGKRWGFEFKYSDAPRLTKSLRVALEDLSLERAWIVYPGRDSYPIHEKVEVIPLSLIPEKISALI